MTTETDDRAEVATITITVVHDEADGVNRYAAILSDRPNSSYEGYGVTQYKAIADALRLSGWAS